MKFMSCFTMILYFCLHPSNLCIYLCSAPSSSILLSETVIISPLIIFPYLNSIVAHFSTLALSGIHLTTLEEWKAELAKQCEEIGRSAGLTSIGIQIQFSRMEAQRFNDYATTACYSSLVGKVSL